MDAWKGCDGTPAVGTAYRHGHDGERCVHE